MIKVFEAFAGYGSQALALERINVPHKVVAISEIDKYAIKAYEALHGNVLNMGDICNINAKEVPDHDLMTYSFPCQDISIAGGQKGLKAGETRSGLLWECERIIKAKKPKYLLMENVKNLVSKKFMPDLKRWQHTLGMLGYTNYTSVLNACDYGVPQNRERVFMVSILGKHKPYVFPKPINNKVRLIDFLENEVDEKYYIGQEKIDKLLENLKDERLKHKTSCSDKIDILGAVQNKNAMGTNARCLVYGVYKNIGCIDATTYKDPKKVAIPCLTPDRVNKRQNGRRFKADGEPMFTLTGQDRHGVLQIGNYCSDSETYKNKQVGRVYSPNGMCPTLNTMQGGDRQPKVAINNNLYCIRKLTPRECFRLMGLYDTDIDKIQAAGISNSQQYKLAGNSIVVDVLEAIFSNLFKAASAFDVDERYVAHTKYKFCN